jgi:hypothetical protein
MSVHKGGRGPGHKARKPGAGGSAVAATDYTVTYLSMGQY